MRKGVIKYECRMKIKNRNYIRFRKYQIRTDRNNTKEQPRCRLIGNQNTIPSFQRKKLSTLTSRFVHAIPYLPSTLKQKRKQRYVPTCLSKETRKVEEKRAEKWRNRISRRRAALKNFT